MADSGTKMFKLRIVHLLSFTVYVVAASAPAPAPAVSNTNSTTTTPAINTSSPVALIHGGGSVAPSFSAHHDLDTDGGGRSPSSTLCLHRASKQAYDGVVSLKDGSRRLLFWKREGLVCLAEQVDVGIRVGGKPVIDLRTHVSQDSARGRGLAGVAVDSSSRVYVSYYYTTTVGPDGGSASSSLVVDHLSVSWSEHEPTTTAATRVFSADQSEPPSSSGFPLDYYGGQILFRPTTNDPYLYFVTGTAQTNGQLGAQILRLPVGQDMPLGGNGTEAQRRAYASVFGIPRRCAFDVDRPQDLYCAIVKDDQEQVFLVSDPDAPSYSDPAPIPSLLVANQRPTPETRPSLVGGVLYRGDADTTLAGSYVYMYGSEFWVAEPSPVRNSSTTRNLRVTCSAATTTPPCHSGGEDFADGAAVTSFGEDGDKNVILLATDAIYQVVAPSLCDAPTHNPKAQAPASNKTNKDLLWRVLKVIGVSLGALGGSYLLYRYKTILFKFCNPTSHGHFSPTALFQKVTQHYYGARPDGHL